MHNIIIDTDPGLDDAIAILLALAYPEACTVKAITTVAGNQTIEKVTRNALKILNFAGVRVPVAAGAPKPLARELLVESRIHGETGLNGSNLPDPDFTAENRSAEELLLEVLHAGEDPITLVPIGPATNIALLFRNHPDVKQRIGLISLMGGSLSAGNITMAAEFNVYTDPEAAKEVFASGIPIVMSGLDVTHKAYITTAEIDELRARGPASLLVANLVSFYGVHYEKAGMPGAALHDPCSIAYLIRPDLFSHEDLFVDVETKGDLTRGMTVADRRPASRNRPNVRVLVDVDRKSFIELLFEGLGRIDRSIGRSARR
ncbi:MAG TPA: nucleoside hydrolase [Spirochaetia bacterium]|nr:nucleoside hydrolase [Spirochaetia bacterium]